MNHYKAPVIAGKPLLIQSRREIAAILADMKYNKRTKYDKNLMQGVLAIFQKNGTDVKLLLAALEAEGLATSTLSAGRIWYRLSSKALVTFLVDTERERMVVECDKNQEKETTLQSTYIYKSDMSDLDQVKKLLYSTTQINDEDTSCGKTGFSDDKVL